MLLAEELNYVHELLMLLCCLSRMTYQVSEGHSFLNCACDGIQRDDDLSQFCFPLPVRKDIFVLSLQSLFFKWLNFLSMGLVNFDEELDLIEISMKRGQF